MRQRRIAASLAIVLALGAAPALAQQDQHHPAKAPPASAATPPPTTQGMPMGSAAGTGGGMPMMGMMGMMMGQDGMGGMAMMATAMAEHVEGRLAFLKTELKITDAQLPLWNTFAQALRDNAKTMGSMMQGGGKQGGMMGMNQSATLPEKLATREKMMTAHLEGLHKLKAAVDPLYAALTEEQKKTADQLMLSPMGMM
jgi:LTXXQ motif family protein